MSEKSFTVDYPVDKNSGDAVDSAVMSMLKQWLTLQLGSLTKQVETRPTGNLSGDQTNFTIVNGTFTSSFYSDIFPTDQLKEIDFYLAVSALSASASPVLKIYVYSLDADGNKYLLTEFQQFSSAISSLTLRRASISSNVGTRIIIGVTITGTNPSATFKLSAQGKRF